MATIVSEPEPSIDEVSEPNKPVVSKPTARPRKKKLWNNSMKFVRRVHLYSGIFMFPFVLLYGITGWLFNHPGYLSGDETTSFVGSSVADGSLAEITSPDAMAAQVVAAINANPDNDQTVVLTTARPAQYTGFMSFSAKGDNGTSHFVRLDPTTGNGEIRTAQQEKTDEEREQERLKNNPLSSVDRVQIEDNGFKEAQAALPAVFDELGIKAGEVKPGRRSPSLGFAANVNGIPSIVSYNLSNGAVSAVREDSLPETKTKNFLLRLHLSRTYSPYFNIRWFWALLVDGMVISMVFWGLSGLIMWWQIKRTRLLGGGFLVASIICTSLLVVGMHNHGAVSNGIRSSRPREQRNRERPAEQTEQKSRKSKAKAKAD